MKSVFRKERYENTHFHKKAVVRYAYLYKCGRFLGKNKHKVCVLDLMLYFYIEKENASALSSLKMLWRVK